MDGPYRFIFILKHDKLCQTFIWWLIATFLLTFSKWLSFNVNSYLTNMRQNVNAKTTIIQLETARCSQLNFIFGVLLSTIIGCNQIEPSNKFIRIWSVLFGAHDICIWGKYILYNLFTRNHNVIFVKCTLAKFIQTSLWLVKDHFLKNYS